MTNGNHDNDSIIDSIKMSPEELRQFGDLDNRTDEELEQISDFLARYSVIIYKILQKAKKEGRLEEIE